MQLVGVLDRRTAPHAVLARRKAALLVAVSAVALVGVHVVLSLLATEGVFTYLLDDPYIHLALSEQIAQGHYGLAAGAVAAPSSSILWPALLAPFAGTAFHGWMPLLLNAAAAAATASMLFLFLDDVLGVGRLWAAVIAVAVIEVLYVAGVALGGMEHGLQAAVALATTIGVIQVTRTRTVPWWLVLALVSAPLIRFEGLAAAVFGAAVIAFAGHRKTALFTVLAAMLSVVAFGAFLVSLGLDPLPSSVLAKSAAGSETGVSGMLVRILETTYMSVVLKPALWLLLAALCAVATRPGPARPAYLFGCATLLANMVLATGPAARYDVHLLMVVVPLLVYAWSTVDRDRVWRGFAAAAFAGASLQYGLAAFLAPAAAQEIYLQHQQTSRFVAEVLQEPVAVNDLGLVELRSEHEVLDLWGLAHAEARRARLAEEPGWMQRIVAEHGVEVAMVYEEWFPDALPDQWVRIGRLRLDDADLAAVGGRDVAFFAVTPDAAARLRRGLEQFDATLPPGVTLLMDRA